MHVWNLGDPLPSGELRVWLDTIERYAGDRHQVRRSTTAAGKARFEFQPLPDAIR